MIHIRMSISCIGILLPVQMILRRMSMGMGMGMGMSMSMSLMWDSRLIMLSIRMMTLMNHRVAKMLLW